MSSSSADVRSPDPRGRVVSDLGAEIGRMSLAGPRAGAGLRTALASVLAILAALALDLDEPWWAGITGLVLVQGTATATWSRAVDRVMGTIAGAALGYLAAGFIGDHLLFQLICVAVSAFTFYAVDRVEHSYAILLGGVTVMLVLFGSLETPGLAMHLAIYRALEVIVGVGVATGVDYALADRAPPAASPSKPGIWSRPVDRDLAAVALSGGIAIALIPVVWGGLQIPGLGQTPITAFVVVTALGKDPGRKAFARAFGCLVGGAYGLLMMHLVGDAFVPWLVALALGLFASADLAHGESDVSYVGLQAGFGIILAMVQGSGPSPDILPAIDRMAGILGGIVLVAVCHPVLTPAIRAVVERLGTAR